MKTDIQLQKDVLEELSWEPAVDAAKIGVTNQDGVVTLTGHVATHTEKHAAEKVAKRVHGVKAVANKIEVRPHGKQQLDDEHVAAAAVHALTWDANVPVERVQVTVRSGWITLEGTVDHRFERKAAERAVRNLVGARGLTNNILVAPLRDRDPRDKVERDVVNIKTQIEDALRRSALVNSRCITVEVHEDTVTLTGDVHSHAEHEEVERIAWTPREVSCVENCVTITPWGEGPMEEWGY